MNDKSKTPSRVVSGKKFSGMAQRISARILQTKIDCTLCKQEYYPGWQCPTCQRFLCETCAAFVYRIRDSNYRCFYCDYSEGKEPLNPIVKEFFKMMKPEYMMAALAVPLMGKLLDKTGFFNRRRRKKLKIPLVKL